MPIEIKELHIKAVVAPSGGSSPKNTFPVEEILKLKKEITKEVTEKVLKTLQQKNER